MAPFACFAILPVSRINGRPPTSTVTEYGAGVILFSDIYHFLWLRVRAERSCRDFCPCFSWTKRKRGECIASPTKCARSHQNKFRPNYGRTRNDSTGGHTAAVRHSSICSFAETR